MAGGGSHAQGLGVSKRKGLWSPAEGVFRPHPQELALVLMGGGGEGIWVGLLLDTKVLPPYLSTS